VFYSVTVLINRAGKKGLHLVQMKNGFVFPVMHHFVIGVTSA
jgi:hypothetical protein